MIGADREMQRVTGPQAERVLIGESRCGAECAPEIGSRLKVSTLIVVNIVSASARCCGSISPDRSLIESAEENSVVTQSLIASSSGS